MHARPLGDAVAGGDGVELDGHAACLSHALLGRRRQVAQVIVARRGLRPGVDDRHDRLPEVLIAEAHRPVEGAGIGPCEALQEPSTASPPPFLGQSSLSSPRSRS